MRASRVSSWINWLVRIGWHLLAFGFRAEPPSWILSFCRFPFILPFIVSRSDTFSKTIIELKCSLFSVFLVLRICTLSLLSVVRLASWFVDWLVASIGKCALRAFRLGKFGLSELGGICWHSGFGPSLRLGFIPFLCSFVCLVLFVRSFVCFCLFACYQMPLEV